MHWKTCVICVFVFYAVASVQTSNTKSNEDSKDENGHGNEYDPCESYNPEKPSFKASGRRISEETCEEYIWNAKLNEKRSKRHRECLNKMNADKQLTLPVGGSPTLHGQYPHMGVLGWKTVDSGYVFKCGSSLISPKFVLTAAHCSRDHFDESITYPSPTVVRFYDKKRLETNSEEIYGSWLIDINIVRIINHPSFKAPKKYYDIALMELEETVLYTPNMQPACLWTKSDHNALDKDVTLVQLDYLHHGNSTSPELYAVDLNIIDPEQCDRLLSSSYNRHFQGLMEHQLCAGKLSAGVDDCQNDLNSVGPLQNIKYKEDNHVVYNIIGMSSFGFRCVSDKPEVFTRVSSFIDWIESIVWSNVTK